MATVTAYWRPTSISQAFEFLDHPGAVVLAGGTSLNERPAGEAVEVVDLQALGLDAIEPGAGDPAADGAVVIGAMATLQQVVDSEHLPAVVREAARREQPSTLRAQATVGGCIATGDWESELLAALLVHDAVVRLGGHAGTEERTLQAVLADLPLPTGMIVMAVTIETSGAAAMVRTARTGADRAIVSAAVRDADGRRRMALSGVAPTPVVVDGAGHLDPGGDFRGSSEYRRALAVTLLDRAVEAIR